MHTFLILIEEVSLSLMKIETSLLTRHEPIMIDVHLIPGLDGSQTLQVLSQGTSSLSTAEERGRHARRWLDTNLSNGLVLAASLSGGGEQQKSQTASEEGVHCEKLWL